ncbi:olfactory receptor 5V1-like [Manis pentadactyla]|uniref:olfactory receptor 5V1-like n=1 Tax=Manis pentadactyla TaxID=143292 RepID=UPI00255C5204|nr:olfactory receptor 5V1-like [Manis pentadactyla]
MYYFLANLSFLDIFRPSATVPKMLDNLLTGNHSISFLGCALKAYFLVTMVGTEFFLLTVMGHDRYLAICFPLCHDKGSLCSAGSWDLSSRVSRFPPQHSVHLLPVFLQVQQVNQSYCDIPPLVALSCSSKSMPDMLILVERGISGIGACLITFISYIYIISAILKTQSVEGKRKAFSTCASHLLVVCLFCGTAMFTYVLPSSSQRSQARHSLISMLYGVITPMLNPVIFSLRNTEVKGTLSRILCH